MNVINPRDRLTTDWDAYSAHVEDRDNCLICIQPDYEVDSPISIYLRVGQRWYPARKNKYFQVPADGLKLPPGEAAVIETKEHMGVPGSFFGLVTGRGRYIWRGAFVSPGKIDPYFEGHLKVGFYNGGSSTIVLKPGDSFCSASFFRTDDGILRPPSKSQEPQAEVVPMTFAQRLWSTYRVNRSLINTLIALAALIVAIMRTGGS